MEDIDLLVEEQHLEHADGLIRGIGDDTKKTPYDEEAVRDKHRHYPTLVSESGLTRFEVHRNLVAVGFSQAPLRRGDILLFRQVDYLTVHRLLGTARLPDGGTCLRTRGDGGHRLDPPLDRSRVYGRVFAVLRDGGWRDMRPGRARLYARALALHDLAWAAVGVLAARLYRRAGREGSRRSLETTAAFVDQKLLGLFHRLLFSWIHQRIDRPEGLEEAPKEEPHCP